MLSGSLCWLTGYQWQLNEALADQVRNGLTWYLKGKLRRLVFGKEKITDEKIELLTTGHSLHCLIVVKKKKSTDQKVYSWFLRRAKKSLN